VVYLGVSDGYIEEESERQRQEIARRMKVYRAGAEPIDLQSKDVIIVDDGIATGSTMKAALLSVRIGALKASRSRCRLVHPNHNRTQTPIRPRCLPLYPRILPGYRAIL
jgi:pyrimidine operon attenuation protein/uracil phosphoribosyltransferase